MRGVILVPTRELAIQVAGAVHRYGRDLGVSVLPVYGGQSLGMQAKALSRGVDVVVATPGRALDLMRRRSFVLEGVKAVVLDEADEMLDLGFAEDLEAILEATPKTRQTALFSATLPQRIKGLAERRMRDPVRVAITSAPHARRGREAAAGGLHRGAGAEGGRPRPRARHGGPDLGARLLPHAQRGGRAAGVAGRPRLPRGRHPRRDDPGPARPGDEALPRRVRRPAHRHRRGRARARHRPPLPRRELRRARLAGDVRPPHRPHRARGTRPGSPSPWPSPARSACCARSRS